MADKKLFSTSETAKIMGISRVAVFKKIKNGQIKAIKLGRNFFIKISELNKIMGIGLGREERKNINKAVERVIEEYGKTLQLLGKE